MMKDSRMSVCALQGATPLGELVTYGEVAMSVPRGFVSRNQTFPILESLSLI